MSFSKRILFGDDPRDDTVRAQMQEQTRAFLEPFKFKIPTRRKNPLPGPRWDLRWLSALQRAIAELKFETVNINDQVCTRSKDEAALIKARAEELYRRTLDEDTKYLAEHPAATRRR